jgi:hypothetical protein
MRFARTALTALGSLVLAVMLAGIFIPKAGHAMSTLLVEVVNTPNVNVVNTPSVSVTGTPNVNVANMPTVGIDPTANTITLLREPENPARQPFQSIAACSFAAFIDCADSSSITVPSGKELVIEFVSAYVTSGTGVKVNRVQLDVTTGGTKLSNFFGPTLQFDNGTNAVSVGSFPTRLYEDGGSTVGMECFLSGTTSADCTVTVSGYLVNVP